MVKASGEKPLVLLLANPMQTDLDTMLACAVTLEGARIKYEDQKLTVAMIGFFTGRPDGESSKPWLVGQYSNLSRIMGSEKLSLGVSPIGSKLRTGLKLRDGFKNAAFIVRGGVVKGICDSVTYDEGSQKRLSESIDKAMRG